MADLRISELAALAGADLVAGDLLAVADISASETKKITVTDFLGNAVTLIADATIPNAKILFSSASIPGSALQNGAVDTTQLADEAVTAGKLADESTVDLVTTLPASGAFVGQIALDTDDDKAYIWDGSSWVSFKAAGSINSVVGSSAGVVNISVSTSGDEVTISTTLDNTSAAAQFLAGPTAAAGAVGYRTIAGGDLPTATTSAKGGVVVNGNGLAMSGDTITIDNTVVAETTEHHIVQYDANGLITAGRTIIGADVPAATAGSVGVILPGTGVEVDGAGTLNHSNTVTPATGTKVTYDSEGHITGNEALIAADIPDLDAAKIVSGTFDATRLANDAVTGEILADRSTAQFGDIQPTADYVGQLYFNSLTRDIYIWDSNVWQPIGISIGEIVFAGTFDASAGGGTGLIASVTSDGTAIGLVVGDPLPAAAEVNNRYYLVVSEGGTITSGNAPNVLLSPPDIILSNGNAWTEIDVSQTVTSQTANNVSFTPAGNISATNVQAALEELDSEKISAASPTFTGNVTISTGGTLIFEGATANDYETTFTVTDPTADRTITFPDRNGTVITTGDTGTVTNTMLAGSIAYSKLAALTNGNIIVGNVSNVPTAVAVTGDVTISNAGVTAIASGAIVNADINASAAIAGTKVAPDFGSQDIVTTGVFNLGNATDTTLSRSAAGVLAVEGVVIPSVSSTNTLTNKTLTDPAIVGTILEDVYTITDGAAFEVDPGNGSVQLITLGANRTPKATNFAAGESVTLMVNDGTAYTLTWTDSTWGSGGVTWVGGSAPTLETSGYTVIQFWKVSSTVYGALVGGVA